MPAIHLPRLRKQVHELALYSSEPKKFLAKLKDLFDYYGNRTLRPSQVAARPTAIPAAHVPQPVLRQIVKELTPHANQTPHLILDLSRELWKYGWMEQRILACHLLGKLPLEYEDDILQLAENWCRQNHEEQLIHTIAEQSLASLHAGNPPVVVAKAEGWIDMPNRMQTGQETISASELVNFQKLGLRALIPLIEDPNFENLPLIYNTLQATLESPPKVVRPDLLDILKRLARRSPRETAFYIRKVHQQSPSSTLSWLIRHSLNAFPHDLQGGLRKLANLGKGTPN